MTMASEKEQQHQILLVGGEFNQFNVEWYGTCHG